MLMEEERGNYSSQHVECHTAGSALLPPILHPPLTHAGDKKKKKKKNGAGWISEAPGTQLGVGGMRFRIEENEGKCVCVCVLLTSSHQMFQKHLRLMVRRADLVSPGNALTASPLRFCFPLPSF